MLEFFLELFSVQTITSLPFFSKFVSNKNAKVGNLLTEVDGNGFLNACFSKDFL